MDYKRIHDAIIENRRKMGNPSGYSENHHVIPKSFGGSDAANNLVRLTAKEHFIIHRLLAKIYPNSGMVHAIFKMSCITKADGRYRVSSRTYEYLREQHSKRISEDKVAAKKKSETLKGRKQSPEHAKKRAESRKSKGQWLSEETKKKIGESNKGKLGVWSGKHLTPEMIEKRNATRHSNGNYSWTEGQRKKASETHKGIKKGPRTEEQKEKQRKKYLVNGSIVVENAKQYCLDNELRYQKFINAANSGKPYKGIHVSKMEESFGVTESIHIEGVSINENCTKSDQYGN
jgi:hypothetical protein